MTHNRRTKEYLELMTYPMQKFYLCITKALLFVQYSNNLVPKMKISNKLPDNHFCLIMNDIKIVYISY